MSGRSRQHFDRVHALLKGTTATAELLIPPASFYRGRVPKRVVETVYDDTAPWAPGISEVTKRFLDRLAVFVR